MDDTDMKSRQEFLGGMAEMLCFLTAHPDVPLPSGTSHLWSWVYSKKQFAKIARTFTGEKGKDSHWLFIRKEFGPIRLMLAMAHETAECKRVVTGKKWVEAHRSEGYYEDVVEWHCDDAILAMDKHTAPDDAELYGKESGVIQADRRADDLPY